MFNGLHEVRRKLTEHSFETARHYLSGRGNKERNFPKIGYVLSLINFYPREAHLYDALQPADPEEFPDGTRLLLDVKDGTKVNLMELFPSKSHPHHPMKT